MSNPVIKPWVETVNALHAAMTRGFNCAQNGRSGG